MMSRVLLIAFFLAVLAVSAVFAPGATEAASEVRIGIDPGYPPFSRLDDKGRVKGFDVDIALSLCAKMKAVCEFVRHDWEDLIPGLRAGKFDAIVSSMSITEKRRRLVAFTERYYSNVVRFIARKGGGFDPAAPEGRRIGSLRATIASDWLEENLAGIADIRLFSAQEALLSALAAGRMDAVFGDGLGFWNWLQGPQGTRFGFVGEGYHLDEGIGVAVRKGDETLRRRLNRALEAILSDGTYERINARYFPFSIH